ncbi:MAG: MFS transporter [Bacteroidales bacterium]
MTDKQIIPRSISKRNFSAFLWHAAFLAFAQSFMDVDTIIPAMIVESGGNAFYVGLMTAIMLGGSSFSQIIFAPYISNRPYKKNFLLSGINARIASLIALGILLYFMRGWESGAILLIIFLLITIFSLGGAFANIAYIDIMGKAINPRLRKKFFSSRQIINGIAVLISAYLAKELITARDYPENYAWSFFIGGMLLFIASLGFWRLKETLSSQMTISNIKEYFSTLRTELKENRRLVYFLGFINTQGVVLAFLPFVMLYAKESFNSESKDTGIFLLSKTIGLVLVSILVFIYSGRIKYSLLLYVNIFLSVMLSVLALSVDSLEAMRYIFILGGIAFSLYKISMNGVLLEVSGNHNRALYAGFAGAGNILPAVFPLLGGWVIDNWGFNVFCYIFIAIISLSLFFVYRMRCTN